MPFLALWLWTRGKVALKGGDISTPTGRFRLLMNMYTTKRTAILFHFDGSNYIQYSYHNWSSFILDLWQFIQGIFDTFNSTFLKHIKYVAYKWFAQKALIFEVQSGKFVPYSGFYSPILRQKYFIKVCFELTYHLYIIMVV